MSRVTPELRAAVLKFAADARAAADRAHELDEESRREENYPLPLKRMGKEQIDFPLDSFGDLLAPAIDKVSKVVKAPISMVAQSFLSASALAVQPFGDVLVDGRRIPTSLFCLSIAESGDRKTAVDKIVLKAHNEW
jgi:hypothetical protein